jgi:hypothetical protein
VNRAVFAAILALAFSVAALVRAETLVALDYSSVADATNSCDPNWLRDEPWRRLACIDPIGDFDRFTSRMDAQFSANPLCHDMKFISKWVVADHWYFFIYLYRVGNALQSWKLATPDKHKYFAGEGTPEQIVQDVCAVISGRGGRFDVN